MISYSLTIERVTLGKAGIGLKDRHGPKLVPILAAWTTLIGPLNRNWLLQPFSGVGTDHGPNANDSEIELLRAAVRPFSAAEAGQKPLHELRCYKLEPGTAGQFIDHLANFLPHRERYSPCLGAWTSISGCQDRLWHMWAYRSLEEREIVRERLMGDPVGIAYNQVVIPYIREQRNWLLKPVSLD
jgi:hypothetical protein